MTITNRYASSRRTSPLVLLWAITLTCAASAGGLHAAERYGDIIVSVVLSPDSESQHGYGEYRFAITNKSAKKAHTVTLTMPEDTYSGTVRRIERTISVAPDTTAEVSLFQPAMPIWGSGVRVSVDGRRYDDPLPLNMQHYTGGYHGSSNPLCILVGRDLGQLVEASTDRTIGSNKHGYDFQYDCPGIPVSNWGTNWLGYGRYDGVVVSAAEFRRIPAAVREAITSYVECGGSLLVVGDFEVPAHWGEAVDTTGSLHSYRLGFGSCMVNTKRDVMEHAISDWQRVSSAWLASRAPWGRMKSVESANKAFPVVEDLAIPVRGMYFLMILFAVIIGPVNLIVLSKMRRRIWMLWTVPAVSLLTCLAIFGYSLWSEGITGHRRTETLTILDQRTHRATSIGWTAFYCPLTPGSGPRFSYDTELTLQVGDHGSGYYSGYEDSNANRTMDWTHDQHLTSGWVNARVPAHFRIRRSERRRERLGVTTEADGTITVVNGLGAPIKQLHLADRDGRIHTAGVIAPGAKAQLSPPSPGRLGTVDQTSDVLGNFYRSDWTRTERAITRYPNRVLRPGTYMAVLEGAPFVQAGLEDTQPHSCRTVVYGIMEGDSNGS